MWLMVLVTLIGDLDSDISIARARSRAAMVMQLDRGQVPVPPVPPGDKTLRAAKPKVLYVKRPANQGRCVPCEIFEANCKKWNDCPVEFAVATANKPVDYPFFCWQDESGKWWELSGWHGEQAFVNAWSRTRPQKATANPPAKTDLKPVATPQSRYSPGWNWPGSLASHLLYDHGINPAGLSEVQLMQVHDTAHDSAGAGPDGDQQPYHTNWVLNTSADTIFET